MTDNGSDNEPDLWANTVSQPSVPPSIPPSASDPTVAIPTNPTDPTMMQPTGMQPAGPGGSDPTMVQPVTPGPLNTPGSPTGIVTGPGMPPGRQPPAPPMGGGPGVGPGGPVGPNGPERPAWALPAAIGLAVAVLAGGLVFLLTRDGGDDSISTDVSSTTSIATDTTTVAPETTIVGETTIAPETTVAAETTVATETTVAPDTTAAPTTAAPTTAAPTTVAPGGITPASPGTALIADQSYPIASACVVNSAPGLQYTNYLIDDGDPGTIVGQGIDEGNIFGVYAQMGSAIDTSDYVDFGDDGFGMLGIQGDGSFDIAVNPGNVPVVGCETIGTVRLSDPATPETGYTHGIVDLCTSTDPFTMVGYVSEGGRVQVTDNGDGTAQVAFDSTNLFDATDPDATFDDGGGRVQVDGVVTGSTIEDDTTQAISIDFTGGSVRSCGEFEFS